MDTRLAKFRFRVRATQVAHLLGIRIGASRHPGSAGDLVTVLTQITKKREIASIRVVASGPSARGMEPNLRHLYVACNDSYLLCPEGRFLYAFADHHYTRRYITWGLRKRPSAALYWSTAENAVGANLFAEYLRKYSRAWPEFLATNIDLIQGSARNYEALAGAVEAGIGYSPRLMNAGMIALNLGWILAHIAQRPLEVYGLDLGFGPEEHFDGTPLTSNLSVSGARVRDRTFRTLSAIAASDTELVIRSNFPPRGIGLHEPSPWAGSG